MLVAVGVVVAAGIVLTSAKASLSADPVAIAKVGLPLGGGRIERVTVEAGRSAQPVPITVRDNRIYPTKQVPAGTRLQVQVVVRRPGWIAWLAGKTQRLNLTVTAPTASLKSHFVTVGRDGVLRLHFKSPISAYSYGSSSTHLRRVELASPASVITVPHNGQAGTLFLSAQPRSWETSHSAAVSWFPPGRTATAVANPAPGSSITSGTPITLTFNRPVSKVLGSHMPPVSPTTQGAWHQLNSNTIVFRPENYGYGLGAKVQIPLPTSVHLLNDKGSSAGTWTVPPGSTTRLQQLLAELGYLPFNVNYSDSKGAALTPAAQEEAAVKPPAGKFTPRWSGAPSWYLGTWSPGTYGEITTAAVMAFENTEGMTADGVDGPQVWTALINAAIHHQVNSFGYTIVDVSEGTPESESTWHNGKVVASGAVNTGIPATPTATGTFAVFEHLPVTTMSGTNADGSHYVDPGIPDVSYFNGGDALHGFLRGSYGYPQSDGCVEMPYGEAASVYPYTPIGTIVHVT
ncbi:MAG TPA: L,D-transpeptidase family protein [Solirubrobacteraceae bacterium]|jgi:peptidoglycan hydrolase-like protein with peptidoglycan-binding domain|nr:L,D-transpeptidase family protein [Solirubrobacteraceae bacterium]